MNYWRRRDRRLTPDFNDSNACSHYYKIFFIIYNNFHFHFFFSFLLSLSRGASEPLTVGSQVYNNIQIICDIHKIVNLFLHIYSCLVILNLLIRLIFMTNNVTRKRKIILTNFRCHSCDVSRWDFWSDHSQQATTSTNLKVHCYYSLF